MKKNRILGMLSATLLVMAGACSNEVLDSQGTIETGGSETTSGVFFSVDFTPNNTGDGTRSYTDGDNSSSNGTEIGQDDENHIDEVLIVLAASTPSEGGSTMALNSYVAHAVVTMQSGFLTSGTLGTGANARTIYEAKASISRTDLSDFYTSYGNYSGAKLVNIFVFCNPTAELKNIMDDVADNNYTGNWYDATGNYKSGQTSNVPWLGNHFLMSNISIATRQLPNALSDWNAYTKADTPFRLSELNVDSNIDNSDNTNATRGPVKVERTTARFDFRDGSVDGITDERYNGIGDRTYSVLKYQGAEGDTQNGKQMVNVQLGKMSLVNMDNKYYFLRRVSNNGLDANATICGAEKAWFTATAPATPNFNNPTGGNYVVDAYASWKNTVDLESFPIQWSDYLNFPFFDNDGEYDNSTETSVNNSAWSTALIEDVLGNGTEDNAGLAKKYNIWRYCIESTIPGATRQKNGITTGVVFKGKMVLPTVEDRYKPVDTDPSYEWDNGLLNAVNGYAADGTTKLTGDPNKDPIIYMYGQKLYYTWEHIKRVAINSAISDLHWDKDANNGEGAFTYKLNDGLELYKAVFGNGGFGSIEITYDITNQKGDILLSTGNKETLTCEKAEDPNSANAKWQAWVDAGRPGLTGTTVDPLKEMREAITGNDITIYQTSNDEQLGVGYYMYYYYWNRHNDNDLSGVMAPMEFCVVRNNVYKLAVLNLSTFGHPRISANDPKKPTPDTDDEEDDVYLTVQCQVLPWVVRVNNAIF